MEINKKQIQYTASLAKLSIDTQINKYTENLTKIIHYVEKMNEINTSSILPMTSIENLCYSLRKDKPATHHKNTDLMTLAPQTQDNLYLVPKVID